MHQQEMINFMNDTTNEDACFPSNGSKTGNGDNLCSLDKDANHASLPTIQELCSGIKGKNNQSRRKRKSRDKLAGWLIDRVFDQLVNIRIRVKTPDGGSTIVPKYYQQAWEVLRDLSFGEVQIQYPFSIFQSDISQELRILLFNSPSEDYIVSRVVERIFENASLRLYEESKKNRMGLRYHWIFL